MVFRQKKILQFSNVQFFMGSLIAIGINIISRNKENVISAFPGHHGNVVVICECYSSQS